MAPNFALMDDDEMSFNDPVARSTTSLVTKMRDVGGWTEGAPPLPSSASSSSGSDARMAAYRQRRTAAAAATEAARLRPLDGEEQAATDEMLTVTDELDSDGQATAVLVATPRSGQTGDTARLMSSMEWTSSTSASSDSSGTRFAQDVTQAVQVVFSLMQLSRQQRPTIAAPSLANPPHLLVMLANLALTEPADSLALLETPVLPLQRQDEDLYDPPPSPSRYFNEDEPQQQQDEPSPVNELHETLISEVMSLLGEERSPGPWAPPPPPPPRRLVPVPPRPVALAPVPKWRGAVLPLPKRPRTSPIRQHPTRPPPPKTSDRFPVATGPSKPPALPPQVLDDLEAGFCGGTLRTSRWWFL